MKLLMWVLFVLCGSSSLNAQKDSTQKQWLGVLTLTDRYKDPGNWTKEAENIVGQHFQRLQRSRVEGKVILAGRMLYEVNNPEMQGLVIFYAGNEEEARQFMLDDPAVKNNIMLMKIHPYSIAVHKCD